MPLEDKITAAKKIDALLKQILPAGGFRLRYRITVDPPVLEQRDWEHPVILVDLSGPDSSLLLERGAELLRSFETVVQEALKLAPNEHEKVQFDCMNHRAMRIQELQMAAQVAAEQVRKSGMPYNFSPMTSRERRILHLALRDAEDLKTESSGEAGRRAVVVMPKDYDAAKAARRPSFGRRRR